MQLAWQSRGGLPCSRIWNWVDPTRPGPETMEYCCRGCDHLNECLLPNSQGSHTDYGFDHCLNEMWPTRLTRLKLPIESHVVCFSKSANHILLLLLLLLFFFVFFIQPRIDQTQVPSCIRSNWAYQTQVTMDCWIVDASPLKSPDSQSLITNMCQICIIALHYVLNGLLSGFIHGGFQFYQNWSSIVSDRSHPQSPFTNIPSFLSTHGGVQTIGRKFGTKSHFGECHTEAFVAVWVCYGWKTW